MCSGVFFVGSGSFMCILVGSGESGAFWFVVVDSGAIMCFRKRSGGSLGLRCVLACSAGLWSILLDSNIYREFANCFSGLLQAGCKVFVSPAKHQVHHECVAA